MLPVRSWPNARRRRCTATARRPLLRLRRGLRAAATLDRRGARGLSVAGRPDERVATGLCAAGTGAGVGRRARARRGPTYDRPLRILGSLGAEVTAVGCDEDGLDVDALEAELRRGRPPAFVYVIPTFQNPTGPTLSTERRNRLVELAAEHDLLVLEDDPYGASGSRASRRRPCSSSTAAGTLPFPLVLEDGRPGHPRRLPRPAGTPRACRGGGAASTYITPALLSQATVTNSSGGGSSRGTSSSSARCSCPPRRAARGARGAPPRGGASGNARRAATSSGSTCRGRRRAELLYAAARIGVTFVPGPDFYPWGGGGRGSARLASAMPRRRSSPRASGGCAGLVAPTASVELRQQHAA